MTVSTTTAAWIPRGLLRGRRDAGTLGEVSVHVTPRGATGSGGAEGPGRATAAGDGADVAPPGPDVDGGLSARYDALGPDRPAADQRAADTEVETADQAVTRLYHEHWDRLVRLATLLTRDASVAEEIVQDAFVALHRRWGVLAEHHAAHAYLRTSVVNGARSALRHRSVAERNRQPGPPEPSGPEERALRAEDDARVAAALRTLTRRQQEVLVLRYYGDFSEADIAATLGLSKGAVKSHAHRGLAALRDELARRSGGVTR